MANKKRWTFENWDEKADHIDAARWLDLFCDVSACADSPIERGFGHALAVYWEQFSGHAPLLSRSEAETPDSFRSQPVGLNIWTQCKIGPYRVDFFLVLNGGDGSGATLVVECDGHAFHEKTKEQARRDKRRDRELAAAGTQVVRYTGSEINADPYGCARETLSLLRSLYRKRGD